MLLHDRVARRYFDGEVGTMNPSEADFALACKLAFYCGGDMDQMRRLFLQSALVRGKTLSPRAIAGDYLGITLWNAARRQRAKGVYWVPAKPKTRRPRGGRDGRRQSVTTTAIITLRTARPELTESPTNSTSRSRPSGRPSTGAAQGKSLLFVQGSRS
jgi:hypothetical protein